MRSSPMVLLVLGVLSAASQTAVFQGSRSNSTSDGRVEAINVARSMRERVAPGVTVRGNGATRWNPLRDVHRVISEGFNVPFRNARSLTM